MQPRTAHWAEETAEQFAALAGLAVAINQTTRGRVLGEARMPQPDQPRALHDQQPGEELAAPAELVQPPGPPVSAARGFRSASYCSPAATA